MTIGSSDNGSTRYWPPGSLYTLWAGGHILVGWLVIEVEYLYSAYSKV